jgi:transcriptional regulator with XRE-family HTH domain
MPRAPKAPPGPLSLAVARILSATMEADGVSKSELARRSGIQRTMASDIVRGLQQADIEQVQALSEALGLNWITVLHDAEVAIEAERSAS